MGALIAQKLDAPELEDAIHYALDENFSDDAEVIEFRRRYLRISRLDVTFKGTFERADGVTLRFPADAAGHLSLHIFWSANKPATDAYLNQIAEALKSRPEPIDVFSYNLDNLPDAGRSQLREKGLDWHAMKLPGGRNHQAYRTYAQGDPVAVLVNEYGLAVVRPEIVHGRQFALDPARISESRYIAQLQSVFIGDFLIAALPASEAHRAIDACFVAPPYRYRLTPEQAVANYRKAAKLCREAMDQQPNRTDLWQWRDRRLIALLGIWNLAHDPDALAEAVEQATAALAKDLPPEAQVVPRFCLAKDQLRRGEGDPAAVVADFVKQAGSEDASARALAAACVLALDAKSRDLHETYRTTFLERHGSDPKFYAFTSFLRDRYHRYRLLKANHSRRERSTRGYIVSHGGEPTREPFPAITLKTLDGGTLELPRVDHDKMTLLLFVEPPADEQADFPARLDRKGNPTKDDAIRKLVGFADHLAAQHVNQSLEVVVAFVCDDAKRAAELMKRNAWAGRAAIVPGGLSNPIVQQLGILSADKLPNVFVLRRDGTVAWWASGLEYKGEFGFPFALQLGMKVHIEASEVEYGYKALTSGDYEKAARIFAGPFKPERPDRFSWRAPRHHGRAVALMGLNDWPAAAEAIDIAIDAHKLRHYRGRGPRDITKWREHVAGFTVKQPCNVLAQLWATKAQILVKLGRAQEAEQFRTQSQQPVEADRPDVYSAFHEKLSQLKTGE
jgi:tetratricopeptide (TPR) repeat protein